MAENLVLIRRCVVISISKASERMSIIYALKLNNDGSIEGHPFQLYQGNGVSCIWPNGIISKEDISCRSTLNCQPFGDIVVYRGNTKKEKMGVDAIQLKLDYGQSVFKSIKEACPGVIIYPRKRGAYLRKKPETPCIFLVSLERGRIQNERLVFRTKEDEQAINLKLNCREHLTLSSKPVGLEIRKVQNEKDVGDTALIRFEPGITDFMGKPTYIYSAVCEGLILKRKSQVISIDEEPVKIQDGEGEVVSVPGNNVKFDTANDAATAMSSRLLKTLRLEPHLSKKIHVKGIGGDMDCSMVEISLHIRRHKFTVFAAVDAVAGETDLLIGNDIIADLIDKFDLTLG